MTPAPSPRLRDAVATMTPVGTRRPMRDWLACAAVLAAVGAAGVAGLGLRRDLGELPPAWIAGFAALWLVGTAALSWMSLVPPRGQVLARARAAGWLAIGFGTVTVISGLLLAVRAPTSTVVASDLPTFARYAGPCFAIGLAVAVAPAVAGLWLARGAVPLRARMLAAGLGASGGAVGGFVLHLHCPIANADHLGLVHGGVPLLAAAAAAALGLVLLDRPRR